MKLAFFDDRAFTVRGAQATMLTVALAAIADGHEVVIISTAPGPLRDRADALGIAWVNHPLPASLDTYGGAMRTAGKRTKVLAATATVRFGVTTARLLRRLDVNAVYLSAMRPALYSWPIGFLRIDSTLYVQGAENLGVMSKLSGLVPGQVAAVSSASIAAIGLDGPCPSWVEVVPAGIAAITVPVRGSCSGPATILTVGEVSADKGQELLAEACAIAATPERPLRLRLVGESDTPMAQEILERIRARTTADFTLAVDGVLQGAAEIYTDARLQALTSRVEGTPKVLAEGLATGLPCLAFAVGGVAEYVGNRPGTTVVEPTSDPSQLAAELIAALDAPTPEASTIADGVSDLDEDTMASRILAMLTSPQRARRLRRLRASERPL